MKMLGGNIFGEFITIFLLEQSWREIKCLQFDALKYLSICITKSAF